MNWIGVDVGNVHCQIREISSTGEIWGARVPAQAERLKATFQARPQARVLLESSTESEWVARILEGLGHAPTRQASARARASRRSVLIRRLPWLYISA